MKKVISVVFAFILALGLVTPALAVRADFEGTYSDVYDNDWFVEDVKYVTNGKLMDGYRTEFCPFVNTTRGELIEAIYRLDGKPKVSNVGYFIDLPYNSPYASSVSWGVRNGIIAGYGDGRVGADRSITRSELVTILYRYAVAKRIIPIYRTSLQRFKDLDQVESWALDAWNFAVTMGLINGTSGTTLSPKDTTTRAEVAAVIHRFGTSLLGQEYKYGNFIASRRNYYSGSGYGYDSRYNSGYDPRYDSWYNSGYGYDYNSGYGYGYDPGYNHSYDPNYGGVPGYLLIQKYEPGKETCYNYDITGTYYGKLVSLSKTGSRIECEYDEYDHLIRYTLYNTTNGFQIKEDKICTYDTRGQLISVKDALLNTSWTYSPTYDRYGRVTATTVVGEEDNEIVIKTLTYEYGNSGYTTTENLASRYRKVKTYDKNNNLLSEVTVENGKTVESTTYTYDYQGRISSYRLYNADKDDYTVTYSYDSRGNIARAIVSGDRYGYRTYLDITYQNEYDEAGNLISQNQTGYGSDIKFHKPITHTYAKQQVCVMPE